MDYHNEYSFAQYGLGASPVNQTKKALVFLSEEEGNGPGVQ